MNIASPRETQQILAKQKLLPQKSAHSNVSNVAKGRQLISPYESPF